MTSPGGGAVTAAPFPDTARRLAIVTRARPYPLAMASPGDFLTTDEGPISASIVLDEPGHSLYCLDTQAKRAIFVKTPPTIDLSQWPFYYQAQHENALSLVAVPFPLLTRLADTVTFDPSQLILLYSVGRCGSTLVARALADRGGVATLSEPDVFTQLAALRGTIPDPDLTHLIRTCLRLVIATTPATSPPPPTTAPPTATTVSVATPAVATPTTAALSAATPAVATPATAALSAATPAAATPAAAALSAATPIIAIPTTAASSATTPTTAALSAATVSASPPSTAVALKFRSFVVEIADLIHLSHPTARRVFLYRQLTDWTRSSVQAFTGYDPAAAKALDTVQDRLGRLVPLMAAYRSAKERLLTPVEMLACQWVSQVSRALTMPHPLHAIRYEDLLANPHATLADLFTFCGLPEPTDLDPLLAKDSQEGTTISQSTTRNRPAHLDEAELNRTVAELWGEVIPARHFTGATP